MLDLPLNPLSLLHFVSGSYFFQFMFYFIHFIVKSAEKIITSCKKCINHAQKIPLVSSIDLAKNHPKKPANITPENPPGFPQ